MPCLQFYKPSVDICIIYHHWKFEIIDLKKI